MIDYSLAKQLKDAGFPQIKAYGQYLPDTESGRIDVAYAPSLSELIEACGKDFNCLVHTTNGGVDSDKEFWSAGVDAISINWSNGHTPEEAVAKLWLALNKK